MGFSDRADGGSARKVRCTPAVGVAAAASAAGPRCQSGICCYHRYIDTTML
jgi:hypothetical protein